MSVHRDCGEPIRWVRRNDDLNRWAPPLEAVGQALIVTEQDGEPVSAYVSIYKEHRCDPEKMLAWVEYQERLAEIKERTGGHTPDTGMSAYQIKAQQLNEENWQIAMLVPCPICDAKLDEYCFNLTERKKGNEVAIRNPHQKRFIAGQKVYEDSVTKGE